MIPTALFLAFPGRYLEPVPGFDPDEFTDEWRYRADPLWGLWDVARSPRDVIENGRGDCVDYSRLAASWLYHHTERPVALYAMGRVHNPPGHLVAYDGERVYSTGDVHQEPIERYCSRTDRIVVLRRGIRDAGGLPRGLWRP